MRRHMRGPLARLRGIGANWRTVAVGAFVVVLSVAVFVVLRENAPRYQQRSCAFVYVTTVGVPSKVYHCSGFSHTVYAVVRVFAWALLLIGLLTVALTWRILLGRRGTWGRDWRALAALGVLLLIVVAVGSVLLHENGPVYQIGACRPFGGVLVTAKTRLDHCSGLARTPYEVLGATRWILLAVGLLLVARSWRVLAPLPPFWAALYLAVIPFAAWLYTLDAIQFYDVNLSREPETLSQQQQVETMLTSILRPQNGVSISYNGAPWYVSTFGVQSIKLLPNSAVPGFGGPTFELSAWVGLLSQATVVLNGHRTQRGAVGPFWFQLTYQTDKVINGNDVGLYSAAVTGPNGQGQPTFAADAALFNLLFPLRRVGTGVRFELGRLNSDSLLNLGDVTSGDLSAAPGLFPRMLYLSATVVTTLGMGDIQPIGTTARYFVTGEAILGVLFAGLFLNALAQRYRRGAPP